MSMTVIILHLNKVKKELVFPVNFIVISKLLIETMIMSKLIPVENK